MIERDFSQLQLTKAHRPRLGHCEALVTLGVTALALTACDGDEDSNGDAGDGHAVATFEVAGVETYRIELDTPELVDHVRQLMAGDEVARIPNGVVVRDSSGVNAPWSWHIDPSTLEFADMTTEVCDGLPSDVQVDVITSDRYCPWLTEVVALDQ